MSDRQRRSSFWAELRRRHVYKVAAVYAAVAIGVWQVADIVVPALGLPAWIMKLVVIGPILTFPLALVLAWAYDITPGGVRATDAADAAGDDDAEVDAPALARRALPFGRRRLAVATTAVVTLVAGGWWMASTRFSSEPTLNEVSLAVFPFAVRGNDALGYLREGVMDLLSRNLSGSSEMQPLDPSLMMKLAGGTETLDAAQAGQLARSVGAGRFVVGTVNGVGGRIRIDAELYVVRDSLQHVTTRNVEGDTTQLFELVDQLTAALLAELTTGAASARIVRTAATTTASLPALKAYLEGEQRYRRGEHEDAGDAFQRALEADSAFALARYRLAMSYHMRGEHDAARREIVTTLHGAERLAPHDRHVIEAFHAFHIGSIADAEQRLRSIVREFPRDLEARVILAELLGWYAPYRAENLAEARTLLEEVFQADPQFMCIYCQLSQVLEDQGDVDGAERMMRLLHGRDNNGDTTKASLNARYYFAALRNDTAALRLILAEFDTIPVERRLPRLLRQTPNTLMHGRFELADTILARTAPHAEVNSLRLELAVIVAVGRGQWAEAGRHMSALRRLPDAPPLQRLSAMHVVFAPFELTLSGLDELRTSLMNWTEGSLSASPLNEDWPQRLRPAVRFYMLGLVASRMRDGAAARTYADSLALMAAADSQYANLVDGLARVVRADVALRADDADAALRQLEGISYEVPPALLAPPISPFWYAATLRVAAHRSRGDHDAALKWLRHAIGVYGGPDGPLYGIYHRDMGYTLDALGRTEDAKLHYAYFVNAWSKADPELQPQVESVRQRLNQLNTR